MANRLASAVSPYLRSHADNPVDWFGWGSEAFDEARERDVPVLVSIGYSTCHWCHVMARESFSDPAIASYLAENFVAIKVDREEHPDVDSSYMTAAAAFTANLGWPLNVFVTPNGRAFHAGTYSPPTPAGGHPSFRQVLEAVTDAWTLRRDQVEKGAASLAEALAAAAAVETSSPSASTPDFAAMVAQLAGYEDLQHGGFGGAPKFPATPVLLMLQRLGGSSALPPEIALTAAGLASRTLATMAASPLRDAVEGGFFRYATRRDWSEPHYERMLYDNALLLRAYAQAGTGVGGGAAIATGIAEFLDSVLRLPSGAFASAQDSESTIDGTRNEGGYYLLDLEGRSLLEPPPLDRKVLTGWNGLAIGALARAGAALGEKGWIALARGAADYVLAEHRTGDGILRRATLDGAPSAAAPSLEDYGMLAEGLLQLALASGEARYAVDARGLVDDCLTEARGDAVFGLPGGGDGILARFGLSLPTDLNEGAYPSAVSSLAEASRLLHLLTGDGRYREAAVRALAPYADGAIARPISAGALLGTLALLAEPVRQLVVVTPAEPGEELATALSPGAGAAGLLTAIVTEEQARAFEAAGFELFAGRGSVRGAATAYYCEDFVCRLPVTDPHELQGLLRA